jgi:hypothetical protein
MLGNQSLLLAGFIICHVETVEGIAQFFYQWRREVWNELFPPL